MDALDDKQNFNLLHAKLMEMWVIKQTNNNTNTNKQTYTKIQRTIVL